MKVIYLPKYNIALVFFFKSASTLLMNFYGKFFAYIGVRAEATNLDAIYREHKDCKLYIFVRNPIHRLISIFYDRFNTSKSLYPISNFKEFLNGYNQFSQTNTDPHFFPQFYNLMVVGNHSWNGCCDLGHYLNADFTKVIPPYMKYQIVKAEDVDSSVRLVLGMFEHNNDLTLDWELLNENEVRNTKVIEELSNVIDEKDKTYGYLLYDFLSRHFNKTHHKNLALPFLKILKREENKETLDLLISLTEKEAQFCGYSIHL